MYVVAGEVIEAVSGLAWEDFVRQRILGPLGMKETMMVSAGIEDQPDAAMAHDLRDGVMRVIPFPHIDAAGPAGSMQSNVAEMARWIAFLLSGGRATDPPLLQPETAAELFRPQTILSTPPYPAAAQAGPTSSPMAWPGSSRTTRAGWWQCTPAASGA